MDAIVINPDFNTGRRRFQKDQLGALGITAEYFAVSAQDLTDQHCQTAADAWTRRIGRKDIACFQSHRLAWQRVVDRGVPMLIIEDDVILSPRIKALLDHLDAHPGAPDTIYDLEYVPRAHLLSRRALWKVPGLGQATLIHQNKHGLGAYILSPEAARRMLAELPVYAMVDAWFWSRKWPTFVQVEPALGVQMVYVRGFPELERAPVDFTDRLYVQRSYLRAKLIRLRLKLHELPLFLRGTLFGEKRRIALDRAEFAPHADVL